MKKRVPLAHKLRLSRADKTLIIDRMGAWLIEHGHFPDDPVEREAAIAAIIADACRIDEEMRAQPAPIP